ncbi:MAG TPA: transglutaminase domain-containing protein [Gemmatimonadales bacterium]|nr:transglutaminase domain-containing protein [Gemmatimonadales bacterium]
MNRKTVGILILIIWALSMAWLVRRVYFQATGSRLANAALSVQPGATYYRVDVGGHQVGYASTTLDTLVDSLRVVDADVIETAVDGHLHRTTSRSEAKLSRALRLETIEVKYTEDGHAYTAAGAFTPDSIIKLAVSDGHLTARSETRTPRTPMIPSLMPLRLAFGGEMKVGATFDARVFDSPILITRDVHVLVAAETTLVNPDSAEYDSTTKAWVPVHFDTTQAFRIEGTGTGGPFRLWIDPQGRVVREERPTGVVYNRTAFELAVQNFRHRDTVGIKAASLPRRAGLVENFPPERADPPMRTMRVRLGGAPLSSFDLAGGGQSLSGDTVTVRQFSLDSLQPRYRVPLKDTLFSETLHSEPLLPVDVPELGFPLTRLIGQERDPVKVAGMITHWVYQTVKHDTTALRPEALLSLASGKGDFDGVNASFMSMARSAQMPVRRVAGVRRVGDRFYYYEWAEVWLGEWVPVDVYNDQFPADASHLRLMIGMPGRRAVMITGLGTLTLEAQ